MSAVQITRKQGLDKFYTRPEIVDQCCVDIVKLYNWSHWDLVVEPSAGSGNFLDKILTTRKIGLDISPEHPNIISQNFFTYNPNETGNILTIGNPPFGKVSSLAIKFFNHAAEWSDVIAFIVPRTFNRISVQNKLNLNFHLVSSIDLPVTPCCFIPKMNVKCCWQIWIKQNNSRQKIIQSTTHKDWVFLPMGPLDDKSQPTPPTNADFALRAYGNNCGEITCTNLDKLRPKSWHFISSKINIDVLISRFNQLDYSISQNTSRQDSIGRGDLVAIYSLLF